MHVVWGPEGEETMSRAEKHIWNDTSWEFSKIYENINLLIQETQWLKQNKYKNKTKPNYTRTHWFQTGESTEKKEILKAARGKGILHADSDKTNGWLLGRNEGGQKTKEKCL